MKDFISTMLSGASGEISSKRVSAFLLVIAGVVYVFTNQTPDANVLYALFGSATVLLGVGAITRT